MPKKISGLDELVELLSLLDLFEGVDVSDVSMAATGKSVGFTLSQLIASLQFYKAGLRVVLLAITTPVTLGDLIAGAVVQGTTLVAGQKLLLTGQSTTAQNGFWQVAASGAPTRPVDFPAGSSAAGVLAVVMAGTSAGRIYTCDTAEGSAVVDTDNLTFASTLDAAAIDELVAGPTPPVTDRSLAVFSGTTGRLLAAGGVTLDANGVLKIVSSFSDPVVYADAATVTFDGQLGTDHFVEITADRQLAVQNFEVGQHFSVAIKQGTTGNHVPIWWPGILWPEAVLPEFSTAPGRYDVFAFTQYAPGTYTGFFCGRNFG